MKRDRPASSLSEVWEGPERGIKRRVGLPDLSNDGTDTALGVVLAPEPEPQTQDLDASMPASPVLSRLRSGDLPTAYSTPARVRSKAPRPEPPTPTRALAQPQEEGAARCSTPQELVSPRRPHSPPPRPHKPSNSHASQTPPLKAPQHKMKSLTLLDLMDKLPMKPRTIPPFPQHPLAATQISTPFDKSHSNYGKLTVSYPLSRLAKACQHFECSRSKSAQTSSQPRHVRSEPGKYSSSEWCLFNAERFLPRNPKRNPVGRIEQFLPAANDSMCSVSEESSPIQYTTPSSGSPPISVHSKGCDEASQNRNRRRRFIRRWHVSSG